MPARLVLSSGQAGHPIQKLSRQPLMLASAKINLAENENLEGTEVKIRVIIRALTSSDRTPHEAIFEIR